MKDKNKKKLVKKSVDIESEFVGKPSAPRCEKEKKSDVTDEINKFITNPITLGSIMRLLLRLKGPISEHEIEKSKINIYALPVMINSQKSFSEFFIRIQTHKWNYNYYLGWFCLYELSAMSCEQLDKSMLKQSMAHALRKWCTENLDKITILKD